ncbi:UNVERIFIED_CONTAM: hypothetical protein H355_009526, partial [Colinus virginianus]
MLFMFCFFSPQVDLHPSAMSCYSQCPSYGLTSLSSRSFGSTPLASSCNEVSVSQGQDSRVVIQPSPVVVTLPGPILSSFPPVSYTHLDVYKRQVVLHPSAMSCYSQCPSYGPTSLSSRSFGSTPLASSCNEVSVSQGQDSRVVIQPSPVVVTLPG